MWPGVVLTLRGTGGVDNCLEELLHNGQRSVTKLLDLIKLNGYKLVINQILKPNKLLKTIQKMTLPEVKD
jgi:hypothetical protein